MHETAEVEVIEQNRSVPEDAIDHHGQVSDAGLTPQMSGLRHKAPNRFYPLEPSPADRE